MATNPGWGPSLPGFGRRAKAGQAVPGAKDLPAAQVGSAGGGGGGEGTGFSSGLELLAKMGLIGPLAEHLGNLTSLGESPANAFGRSQRIRNALSNATNPSSSAITPGTMGRVGGGGGTKSGGMSLFGTGKGDGPDYGSMRQQRSFDREQRKLDMQLEQQLKERERAARLNEIKGLLNGSLGRKEQASTTEWVRQGGEMVPLTVRSSKDRDFSQLIAQLLG